MNINLDTLYAEWNKKISSGGDTQEKTIDDSYYNLTWRCLFNSKRMQRRYLSKSQNNTCNFCLVNETSPYFIFKYESFNLYGNQYPILPLHLLLFNKEHRVDPTLNEIISLLKLCIMEPNIKILISNRRGSGASVPDHLHIHAFPLDLPIERVKVKTNYSKNGILLQILRYPAWSIKVKSKDINKIAVFVSTLLSIYNLPFNIALLPYEAIVIPRNIEDPKICQNLVDGVGSLETAGIYTLVTEESIKKVSIRTFRIGLLESGFQRNRVFKEQFIKDCRKIINNI